MDKKELFTPLVIAGLAVAFIVVSALVYLSRGDPGLVRRKLRLGGMLLALTGAVNGCGGLTASCYDMAAPNEFSLSDINQDGAVTVDLPADNQVAGVIYQRQGDTFSFRLQDGKEAEVQSADIVALDGAFDENSEEFILAIRPDLDSGTYLLSFYDSHKDKQSQTEPNYMTYKLKVTNAKP